MIRKPSRRRSRQLAAQSAAEVVTLEERALLMGNVTVTTDQAGNVTLTGDSSANIIRVSIVNNAIVVKGVLTKVNGGTTAVALPMAAGTTDTTAGSITVNLGDGIDLVDFKGIKVNGNVTVSGSGGADITVLRKSTVNGDFNVGTTGDDAGKDSLGIIDSSVTGNLNVNQGTGDDILIGAKVNVGGAANLLLGDGNDIATVDASTIAGFMSVNAGTGNDLLVAGFQSGGFDIQMGDGNDLAILVPVKTTGGSANVSLGAGTDGFGLGGGPIASTLTVDGGDGTDRVFIGPQVVTAGTSQVNVESNLSFSLDFNKTNPIFGKFGGAFLKLGLFKTLLGGLP